MNNCATVDYGLFKASSMVKLYEYQLVTGWSTWTVDPVLYYYWNQESLNEFWPNQEPTKLDDDTEVKLFVRSRGICIYLITNYWKRNTSVLHFRWPLLCNATPYSCLQLPRSPTASHLERVRSRVTRLFCEVKILQITTNFSKKSQQNSLRTRFKQWFIDSKFSQNFLIIENKIGGKLNKKLTLRTLKDKM